MAISPINIARISENLRTNFVVDSLQRTQRDLFVYQARIATGRSFVTASEDPVRAARTIDMTQALARQNQFVANLQYGDNFLSAADSALVEINELMTRASVIASQTVGSLTTADEREAEAEIVAAIRQQVQAVGNREFNGRYLFAGRRTTDLPFINAPAGVAYVGDLGELLIRVSDGSTSPISMPGNLVFGALSSPIASDVVLTPALEPATRLDEITGMTGSALERGTLVFNEVGGAGAFTVELSDADTMGDVVDRINGAATQAGAGLTASLTDTGLVITPGGAPVSVSDRSAGTVAAQFGLLTNEPTTEVLDGGPLTPRLTRLTPVEALAGGAGIDLTGGLVITNGVNTATVDLSTAATVQDIINTINNAGVSVLARINEEGTRIDVFNQVSGSPLSIGENGGTTAADLGIRTFDAATPLEQLNFGRGVGVVEGEGDLTITATNGASVDVNLDGAETIGDVIELINTAAAAAGVAITASFAETGNGLLLTDRTGGGGALSVGTLNLSSAAFDLGLAQTVSDGGTTLAGDDVNLTRTEGILDVLVDLENALRADDTRGISLAGGRLDELQTEVTRRHGVIGARSQGMQAKRLQTEDAAATTGIFVSQLQDLDYAEAVTRMQAAMTQLQASLQTSSTLLGVSLMDFLG